MVHVNQLVARIALAATLVFVLMASGPASGASAASREVQITDQGLQPADTSVGVGDTVTWRNASDRDFEIVSSSAILPPGARLG
jgi:plastocyanin